jgi:hypothetical protein
MSINTLGCRIVGFTAVILCFVTVSAAKAAICPPKRAAALQAVANCRKLTGDSARLACCDKAAPGLHQAEAKGQIVVIDRGRGLGPDRRRSDQSGAAQGFQRFDSQSGARQLIL